MAQEAELLYLVIAIMLMLILTYVLGRTGPRRR